MEAGSGAVRVAAGDVARLALDVARDGVYWVDSEGRCLLINRAGAELLGYEPAEMLGVVLHDLVHHTRADGSPYPAAECPLHRASCAGNTVDLAGETFWRRDGSPLRVAATVRPAAVGPAPGGAVVVTRDVTGQWELERARDRLVAELEERNAALERVREELERRERRVEALLRHASDVSLVLGPDDEVVFVSPALREVFGYEPTELPSAEAFRELIHRDDLPTVRTWYAGRRPDGGTGRAGEHGDQGMRFRLRHADGSWRWVEARLRDLRADRWVGGMVVNMRDITTDRELTRRLHHQAHHDALTDLPNRTLLQQRIAQACRRAVQLQRPMAVLVIDLDNFKAVNDTLGHAAGDDLIQAVAGRLRGALREPRVVGRLGGDEFAVLVEELSTDGASAAVGVIAERLLAALQGPLTVTARHIPVSASVGCAVHTGREGAGELLRNADIAMYSAKAAGKGRYAVFEPGMFTSAVARTELESGLRAAVANGELRLHYQPIRALTNGAVTGYEALVRWERPERGLWQPAEFIDAAEATGVIHELGDWVLDRVCDDLAAWQRGRLDGPARVAVNVSPRQLVPGWPAQLLARLDARGIDPADLTVEVTESFLADREPTALSVLRELRDRGVRVAVDDFGTGYSSLARLRHLPVSAIKIDRAFVGDLPADPQAAALVASVIGLAHALGLEVVAEGVETVEQWNYLRNIGCDQAQGYLLGYPQPVDGFDRFPEPPPARPAPKGSAAAADELQQVLHEGIGGSTAQAVIRPLLGQLQRLTGLDSTYLARVGPENSDQIEILSVWNGGRLHIDQGRLDPAHETICKTVLTAGPVISPHAPVEFPDRHLAAELGIHAYAGVPVRTPDGNVVGTLCAVAAQPEPISDWVIRLLHLFADVIGECLDRHGCT